MGLINLLTDPKNFKFYNGGQGYTGDGTKPSLLNIPYGKDQVGGGSSNQPYITSPILYNQNSVTLLKNDFLLRGGTTYPENAAQDVVRLTKMFGDTKSPSGLLFIAKQQLLSRTAVRTQTSGILNEGIYSPLNTLAEAGVVGLGIHLNKQGLNPFAETGAYSTNDNLYGVRVKPTQPSDENRLVTLYTDTTQYSTTNNFGFVKGVSINPNARVAGNSVPVLMSYSGGPGSILGIGTTNIRYSPTSQTFITKKPKTNQYINSDINSNVWLLSPRNINEQVSAVKDVGSVSSPKVGVDFRQYLRSQLSLDQKKIAASSGQLSISPDYTIKNIENRVNLGDPGQRLKNYDYSNYSKGVIDTTRDVKNNTAYPNKENSLGDFRPGLDIINSIPVYRNESVSTDSSTVNDLCKFRIAIIDNDSPNYKTFLHFRAFLGPISDSYNAEWNGFNYLGRGEKFYNYNGFTRQISLSWTVAAQSKQELIPMYKKLNYLASSLTPDYSSTGYMRGNMAQLTVGGYIYEQPGIITSLTYDIGEDTPWEIGISSKVDISGSLSDSSVKELPHIIRVTGFNFIPIHTFRPELQILEFSKINETTPEKIIGPSNDTGFVSKYGSQRYISLDDGGNTNNYDNYL